MQRQDPKEQKELPTTISQDEVSSIGRYDLQVGQWVIFHSDKPIEALTQSQQDIYNRPFLVVTREDASFDSCRCKLIGENEKIYDYCPRVGRLGDASLSVNNKILVVLSKKLNQFLETKN